MQLLSIEVNNFKTFHKLTIDNMLGLSVFIGENGIGKSNIFSIIKILKSSLGGGIKPYLDNKNLDIKELFHNNIINSKLEITLIFKCDSNQYTYSLGIEYHNKNNFNIYKELLLDSNKLIIKNYLLDKKNSDCNTEVCIKTKSTQDEIMICDCLDSIQIYNFEKKLKISSIVSDTNFQPVSLNESNIVNTLYILYCRYKAHFDVVNNVLFMMIPYFKEFIFQQKDNESKRLYIQMLNISKPVSLEKMSSGSIRLLQLATMLSLPVCLRPSLLILQEPEIGLHPAVLEMVADLIDAYSKENSIIVSTQSTILLDKMNINNLYLLKLNNDIHKTDVVKIDIKKISKSFKKYSLSDLWRMNILGNLIK